MATTFLHVQPVSTSIKLFNYDSSESDERKVSGHQTGNKNL